MLADLHLADYGAGIGVVARSFETHPPLPSEGCLGMVDKQSGNLVATADIARRGRVGVRVNFTGEQRLDANPYRSTSEPYTVTSVFGEVPLGRFRLFVTASNLTDVRQTHWDPIARPARDIDGRWTVDAWAPLEGRSINGGIRISF